MTTYFKGFLVLNKSALLLGLLLCIPTSALAGAGDDFIESFEKYPGYLEPLPTFFGTWNNRGWFSTARLPKEFLFGAGLDINIAYLSEDDQLYDRSEKNGCLEVVAAGLTCKANGFTTTKTVPTLFGPSSNQKFTHYYPGLDNQVTSVVSPVSGGVLTNYSTLPFPLLRFSFAFEFSEIIVRTMPLGIIIPDLKGITLPSSYGFAFEHDIGHYFNDRNGALPVDFALGVTFNYLTMKYSPESGYRGDLTMGSTASSFVLLVSKSFGPMELMLDIGYEMSNMTSESSLVDLDTNEPVIANVDIDGRNGFQVGLSFIGHWGYEFMVGQSYGAQSSTNLKVLNFRNKEK